MAPRSLLPVGIFVFILAGCAHPISVDPDMAMVERSSTFATAKVGEATKCSSSTEFPNRARELGLERGEAVVQVTVSPTGDVRSVTVVSATHPVFADAARRAGERMRCSGVSRAVTITIPLAFRVE